MEPRSKKPRFEQIHTEFFYFGLSFCRFQTVLQKPFCEIIPFTAFQKCSGSAEMTDKIVKEMEIFNSAGLGGKQSYEAAEGKFWCLKLPLGKLEECNVYIYCHETCAKCSATLLSQIEECLAPNKCFERVEDCTAHSYHPCLLPFFCDNGSVLNKCKAAQKNGCPNLQSDIESLTKIVEKKEPNRGTKFESPAPPCFNWTENDWTIRLVSGIKEMFPNSDVCYTAEMGLTWETRLLGCLGVDDIATKRYFLFHGAPDIIISRKMNIIANLNSSDCGDTSSSEDELVENSFQRPPLVGKDRLSLPEKLGEVFASLHILLVCKVLRKLKKGKPVERELSVKGCLVDKVCGAVHCSLSVDMRVEESPLIFSIKDSADGILTPSRLCSHLRKLCDS